MAITVVLVAAAVISLTALQPVPRPTSTGTAGGSSGTPGVTATSSPAPTLITSLSTPATTESTGNVLSSTSMTPQGLKGVAFSPPTYDSAGVTAFLSKASLAGQILEWAGDWAELGDGSPATIAQLASQQGMKMMVAVQFFQQSTGELIRPLNSTNEENYLTLAKGFAQQYKPAYFGVGIEVNILYEKNRTAFQEFVSLYGQVYDQVKAVSPGTAVFTIFQLEKMNGLDGGLYGGTNDPASAEWQLMGLFKTDIAAFTTYPGLIYQDPSEIPPDYYSNLAQSVNESVGFTEVGWHTGSVAGGWGSSEMEQAAFVSKFFNRTRGLDRAFVVWSFLYDQNTAVPFNTMGLFYVNGTAKLAWQTWLSGS